LLPQPGQRAADIAFPDRPDPHDGLLSEPALASRARLPSTAL